MLTPFSDTADAFAYVMQGVEFVEPSKLAQAMSAVAVNSKYRYEEYSRQQGKTNQMSCRNFGNKMDELRRCGCGRCCDEYYRLRYERSRYYDDYNRPSRALTYKAPYMIFDFATPTVEVKKVEEIKNYPVKVLVDLLKQQQNHLNSKKNDIDSQKQSIKTIQAAMKGNNALKTNIENKIKELVVALKRLGHKE